VLTRADGQPFGSRDLAGKVYIAAPFSFQQSQGMDTLAAMIELQARYKRMAIDRIVLVSISVDPPGGDPLASSRYAAQMGADPARWFFLSGTRQQLAALRRAGLIATVPTNLQHAPRANRSVGANRSLVPADPGEYPLVLVDGSGQVRGYFNNRYLGMDEAYHRAIHVLHQLSAGP
jgi:protein SCO1/2